MFGAIANAGLRTGVGGSGATTAGSIAPGLLDAALQNVFLAAAAVGLAMTLAVTLMPRTGRPDQG